MKTVNISKTGICDGATDFRPAFFEPGALIVFKLA
jgi:hypothetical protein